MNPEKTHPNGMTPFEIKVALLKNGVSMAEVGRRLDPPVHPSTVSRVIKRHFVSRRVMDAVADAIDRDVKYVFADYFFKSNTKKSGC